VTTALPQIDDAQLAQAVSSAGQFLSGNDLEFFRRVWQTDQEIYRRRLSGIGFCGMEAVLDAGCGMGQWTWSLAKLNDSVHAVDYSQARVQMVAAVHSDLQCDNVDVSRQNIENLAFESESFNAIFCYSVLPITDYRKTLTEFSRVLRRGGRLYLCSNGFGWHLFKFITGHNRSKHYSPRKSSAVAAALTMQHKLTGRFQPGAGRELITPSGTISRHLQQVGFTDITIGHEGGINVQSTEELPRLLRSSYMGLECVYEILATRS